MMQNVESVERKQTVNELKTIEMEQDNQTPSLAVSENLLIQSPSQTHFGPDMSGSDEDEVSEVDSFILDQDVDDGEQRLEPSNFLLSTESIDGASLQTVDPETHARLEALLEAAGIGKLSTADGQALTDPEVLRKLTSSVSCALDEAAQALHRMRAEQQGQLGANESTRSLAEACSDGDVPTVRKLLHEGGSVHETTEEGESLLSLACSAGYCELAQVLLAMKANVEDRGIKGDCTPLMEAASGGHVDIVRLLIANGADVNAQSSAGNTPLHYAACGGYEDVVQVLIESGADVEQHNENGHTPLMEAASAGHVCVAQILLNSGAGINTHSNEFKESALTLACYKGHLEMVKFLLEAGADQEHKTDEMHTALMEASMDGHVEVARLLLDSGARVNMPAESFESPLTLAACGGHVDLASLLIERGANLEEVNDEGYTPLMEAAREGHEEMVSLLLVHGADINAQTEETQETALTLACCGGFLEVADFLIKAGADIELGCSTPLMEAAQEGHLELVKYLLKAGANVHAQTGTGDTALTYACENGHTDVAEVLLQHEAELEHESEGGRTPLMKAARAGHQCTVQFLLTKAGADVNRQTSTNDHTVLSLACAGGHMTVVELLLAHGADPTHKLKDGSTMVIEAAKGGHTQVVKLLLEYPNRMLMNSSPDLTQLVDPVMDEHRVPVQGLVNIVPPSEPDSGPNSLNTFTDIHTCLQNRTNEKELNIPIRTADQVWQNMQKSVAKRTINGNRVEPNKPWMNQDNGACGEPNSQFNEIGLLPDLIPDDTVDIKASDRLEAIINNVMAKELTSTTSREEQILRKQQILEELQKVERELQEKAKEQLLRSAQHQLEQQQQQQQIQHALKQGAKPLHKVLQKTLEEQAKRKRDNILVQDLMVGDGQSLDSNLDMQMSNDLDRNVSKVLPMDGTPGAQMTMPMPNIYDGLLLSQMRQGPDGSIMVEGSVDSMSTGNANNSANTKNSSTQGMTSSQPPNFPLIIDPLSRPVGQQLQNIVIHQQMDQQQQTPSMQFPQLSQDKLLQILSQQTLQQQLTQQAFPQSPVAQQQLQFLPQPQNLQPTVAQQYFTQQQQQQFLQQQNQPQLIQQQLQQQIKPPANTPPIPKQLARKKIHVINSQALPSQNTNSVLGLDTVTSPPSTPLTPTPSPASPQSISPLYTAIDLDAQTESSHDTALTLACAGGHAELVSLLLSKEADIEHRDKKGFTPLILAATAGHVNVVEILLDQGADIEAQSERTKDTALSLACSGGRYEVVELLLAKGANKEHRNVSDYTPLSLAASGGYVNIIKLLLSHGAEINSRTGSKLGISPLMLAAMNGHTAAVKLLLDMGSDINAQIETNRNTALTLACFQGRHEVVSLLVDRKANIEHRAKTGLTPLMEAASGGYVEVGRVLLDKGADVNAPPVPSSRDTALTIAADKGHYRFVDLLLLRGAAVDVKNKKGNSPLWLACNGGHLDVVQQLVTAGADIDSQDNRKVSCLMAAFRKGHVKVVKWMVKHVNQFPSDQELSRYIATVTDKELQKKCLQCKEILESAKDRQAAEANKNATILLEELDKERQVEENKKAAAAKKRQKKKQKKREKQQEKKETEKNSSPEPETDNENENEIEIEIDKKIEKESKTNNKQKKNNSHDIEWDLPIEPPSATTISTMGTTLPTVTESRNSRSTRMKVNNRRERDRENAVILSSPEEMKNKRNKEREKENQRVPDSSIMSVSFTSGSITTTTTTTVTSSGSSSSDGHQINRGGRGSRKRKEGFPIKPVSTTGVSDLDDFGLPESLKISDKEVEKLRKDSDKAKPNIRENLENHPPLKLVSEISPHTLNLKSFQGMTTSPKRGQKKEDGWKEVIRKSKRVQVPSSAISRVIGRGGCNINAIREVSGAHIEVEKQKGSGERFITIKGSAEATRQAHALITALVTDPDKDLVEILPKAPAPEKITQWIMPTEICSVSTSANSSTSVAISPAQKISPKSGSQKSVSHRQSGGGNSSGQAWGSGSPRGITSPRRNIPKPNFPIGTFTSPPATQFTNSLSENKNITRQLFQSEKKKNNTSPFTTSTNTTVTYSRASPAVKVMTSNASFSHSAGKIGSVDKPGQMKQVPGMVKVLQRPASLSQKVETPSLHYSSSSTLGNSVSVSLMQPLSSSSPLSVSTPGDYMPFNNMFNSVAERFLGRKDDSSEKMNFASVAASGVIASTPGTPGNSVGQANVSDDSKVDPVLQAKAPGYKPTGQRMHLFQDYDSRTTSFNKINYQMSSQLNEPLELMKTPGYRASIPTSPGISPRSNESTQSGLSPRSFSGLDSSQHSMSLSSSSSQREEYATPNQPMTLPKIESTLNPNAPDFLSRSNCPMASQQVGPGLPPNMVPFAGMPVTSPSASANLPALYQQALNQQLVNSVINQNNPGNHHSALQGNLNAGSLTQQEFANLIQFALSQGQSSGGAFPPQNVPRAYSPLPPQARPNSAPSIAGLPKEGPSPTPVCPPCAKSPLPVSTPPLPDHLKSTNEDRKQPRPIGGERAHRKGPGAIGSGVMGEYGTAFWGLTGGGSDLNMDWVPTTSSVMTSAPMPSSVMTSSVITGSNLATGSACQSESRHINMEAPSNPGGFIDSANESFNQNRPVMTPMFMNGVPSHYPVPPIYNPGAVGDMVPSMWNSQIKNSVVENSTEEMWSSWNQQSSM